MLFQDRIDNIATQCPQLTGVWIKSGDARMPLKRIWMNESALRQFSAGPLAPGATHQPAELTDDHLCRAA